MNEDHLSGAAKKLGGAVKTAAGDVTGDTKLQVEGGIDRASGHVRSAVGDAKEALGDATEKVSDVASNLGDQAEKFVDEEVAPLAADVRRRAEEYGQEAKEVVSAGVRNASEVVRGYPLLTVGAIALVGFLFGRLTAYQPPRRRGWF